MKDASALITRSDILEKDPNIGDFVLFYTWDVKAKMCKAEVGYISRADGEEGWMIANRPRYKDQVLFVLTLGGYNKQMRFSNPLAV